MHHRRTSQRTRQRKGQYLQLIPSFVGRSVIGLRHMTSFLGRDLVMFSTRPEKGRLAQGERSIVKCFARPTDAGNDGLVSQLDTFVLSTSLFILPPGHSWMHWGLPGTTDLSTDSLAHV